MRLSIVGDNLILFASFSSFTTRKHSEIPRIVSRHWCAMKYFINSLSAMLLITYILIHFNSISSLCKLLAMHPELWYVLLHVMYGLQNLKCAICLRGWSMEQFTVGTLLFSLCSRLISNMHLRIDLRIKAILTQVSTRWHNALPVWLRIVLN